MKIAVYVNAAGEAAGIFDVGYVAVFENQGHDWLHMDSLPFTVHKQMTLADLRRCAFQLADQLADCRILAIRSVPGAVQAFLEGCGLALWRMKGVPEPYLNVIAQQCQNLCPPQSKESPCDKHRYDIDYSSLFHDRGKGLFRIDMNTLLSEDETLTSRALLIPFLKNHGVTKLEVVCSHIPRWFTDELASFGYRSHETPLATGLILSTITPLG